MGIIKDYSKSAFPNVKIELNRKVVYCKRIDDFILFKWVKTDKIGFLEWTQNLIFLY